MTATNFRIVPFALMLLPLTSAWQPAFSDSIDPAKGPLKVGYVIITPATANTAGLVAFETFGERQGNLTSQAGVLPAGMTRSAMLFVSTSRRFTRDLGVAIANPNEMPANVTLSLHNSDGTPAASQTIVVKPSSQTAQFVSQLFSGKPAISGDFTGTLSITSDIPVATVGLRFRGENFSTIPVTLLGSTTAVPAVSAGIGGPGAVVLPQFAIGGGWAAQIVLSNSGTSPLVVRADFYNQDGSPLSLTLNGVTASSFTSLTIPPSGVLVLSQSNASGDDGF